MKTLFLGSICLFSIISNPSLARTKIVKAFDGGVAVCESRSDVGNRAYLLKRIDGKNETSKKEIFLKLELFKCAETKNGNQLVSLALNELTTKYYISGAGELKKIKTKLEELNLVAVSDSSQFLGEGKITIKKNGEMVVHFSLSQQIEKSITILASITESTPEIQGSESITYHGGGFILKIIQ